MKRWIILLLLVLPSISIASPTICTIRFANSCTISITPNETYFIQYIGSGSSPASTFGLTFTNVRNDTIVDSFGTSHLSAWYARTGTNAGTDTITVGSSGCCDGLVEAWPSTDVKVTGNPVDNTCFCGGGTCSTATVPVTNPGNVSTCSVTSSKANDIYQYFGWVSIAASCSFLSLTSVNNGPIVNLVTAGISGCNYEFVNLVSPPANNTIIPSGTVTTVNPNINTTNSSGSAGYLAAQNILLFAGTGGSAKRKLPPFIVNNRGRPHRRVPT